MKYTSSADAPKAYHLPTGDYTVTILEASETVSRSTGADMIKLTLEAEAADGATSTLFDYLVASASSAWKIDTFRIALGQTIAPGEPVAFFVRHPVSRFVSGFNSRMRKGRPRRNVEWSEGERWSFERFRTPDELARALASADPGARA